MSELIDEAQALAELHQRTALENHQRRTAGDQDNDTGYCLTCGEEIPPARLEAQPGALRCIICQTIHELREEHYVGHSR
ncbi:TPA: TraR/DksA family transcriptional regulator [Klebsiella pneumoniae]|uniref:TraR/DksA family transcriptional regulator n=1 Tax=Klebsiella pneumoniae TaxID=573 RepID=UPI001644848B|nr:TraR/DksA family transcriptional regulator [Klebsiella pneumoniae]EKW2891630.1 TraR/DksA family transcriptional regulator [Klebsiella pneumoniae]ELA0627889.1 TraR/DksA family transcriptional regulator [Klebsiella pneumoniae]MBC4125405.1 TraR/DksA family transcriptional regulator [Klebsiella pneumoniae]MBX4703659.1 molecular chaperone DnaK [Klebsiella pneumoniae]MCD9656165.1 TraR/DksA family transcriptional regulator [Klebsiella pneumoniae]